MFYIEFDIIIILSLVYLYIELGIFYSVPGMFLNCAWYVFIPCPFCLSNV